jgi:preprotein translocase subunit SecG
MRRGIFIPYGYQHSLFISVEAMIVIVATIATLFLMLTLILAILSSNRKSVNRDR